MPTSKTVIIRKSRALTLYELAGKLEWEKRDTTYLMVKTCLLWVDRFHRDDKMGIMAWEEDPRGGEKQRNSKSRIRQWGNPSRCSEGFKSEKDRIQLVHSA